jgi:hypothetical protein
LQVSSCKIQVEAFNIQNKIQYFNYFFTRNPQPATRNPQPATRNPQPATRNPQPATSITKP